MASSYVSLDGTGDEITCPDSDLGSFTDSFALVAIIAPDDWTPASWMPIMSKQSNSSDEEWYWQLRDAGAGASFMRFEGYDASDVQVVLQNSDNFTPSGAHAWLRVDFDPDNGSSQHQLDWYWSEDAIDTAVGSVSWTAIGSDTPAGTVTLKNSTTAPTRLGGSSFANKLTGKWYGGWLYSDTFGGTLAASPDYRTSDFSVDAQGHTWTKIDNATWVSATPTLVMSNRRHRTLNDSAHSRIR